MDDARHESADEARDEARARLEASFAAELDPAFGHVLGQQPDEVRLETDDGLEIMFGARGGILKLSL
jgi:hypothetical protein